MYGAVDQRPVFAGYLSVSIEGLEPSTEELKMLEHEAIVGVVLFQRNVASSEQLAALVDKLRVVKPDLIIDIDNEGFDIGTQLRQGVWRCPHDDFPPVPSQWTIQQQYNENLDKGLEMAYQAGYTIAKQLAAYGITPLATVLDSNPQNIGPFPRPVADAGTQTVFDAAPGASSDAVVAEESIVKAPTKAVASSWIIAGIARSFGHNSEDVATLANYKAQGLIAGGVAQIALKHFPDHGAADADSHVSIPRDNRDHAEVLAWAEATYGSLPGKLKKVMPAHVCYTNAGRSMDAPIASYDPFWLGKIREIMGDSTLIISDCASMGAVDQTTMPENLAKMTNSEAPIDIVLYCNQKSEQVLELLNSVIHRPTVKTAARVQKLKDSVLEQRQNTLSALPS